MSIVGALEDVYNVYLKEISHVSTASGLEACSVSPHVLIFPDIKQVFHQCPPVLLYFSTCNIVRRQVP